MKTKEQLRSYLHKNGMNNKTELRKSLTILSALQINYMALNRGQTSSGIEMDISKIVEVLTNS